MVCPKCGVEIKRFDLSPVCKKCGIHIMYYTQEEDLARDAKKTELEFARARTVTAKLKAAFIQGKLPIIRMVLMVAVIGILFVPTGSVTLCLPTYTESIGVSGWGIYQMVDSGVYTCLLSFLKAGIAEQTAKLFLTWLAFYAFTVLSAAVLLVFWLLCFLDIKKGAKRLTVISAVSMGFAIVTAVFSFITKASVSDYSFLRVKTGVGTYCMLLAFGAFLAINVLIQKSDLAPKLKAVDLRRLEIAKKVKAGEIKLDDLPLPILESEEEREKRLNAFAGMGKKKKGEKADGTDI